MLSYPNVILSEHGIANGLQQKQSLSRRQERLRRRGKKRWKAESVREIGALHNQEAATTRQETGTEGWTTESATG